MKNILHTIDTTGPGGAETVFVELASGLDKEKYNSFVAIRGPGWVYDELRRRGIEPYLIPAKGSFNTRYLGELMSLIKRHSIDVVQSHLLGSNVYCSIAGMLSGVPVVSTFHGAADVARERLLKLKFNLINRGSSWVVAVSEHLRRVLTASGSLNACRIVTIYNGIDHEKFVGEKNRSLRQELGIRDTDVLVGAIGNIRKPKGYDVLLRAAAELRERSDRYKFVIAGQGAGELYESLLDLQRRLGLEKTVHFVGFRHDVEVVLNNLDIFVLSSTSEGFSIATVEAMACGLPVVVTRSGGPEEIVTDRWNGLLVDVSSEKQLAMALEELGEDVQLRNQVSRNGAEMVRKRFTRNAMIQAYERLYESLS